MKVEREGQQEALLVQRTFEEFHELHSKLRLIFPSSKLPRYTHTNTHYHTHSVSVVNVSPLCSAHSFPSRFVIGRSRGEATADRRKDELNGYVWHLVHSAPEVAQVMNTCGRRRGFFDSPVTCCLCVCVPLAEDAACLLSPAPLPPVSCDSRGVVEFSSLCCTADTL